MDTTILPLQVNKKELCQLLTCARKARLVMPGGKCRYDKLKMLFRQMNLIDRVGGVSGYEAQRSFSVEETAVIYEAFGL